ncbi:MAG TPA: TolC family protein [Elusimicrobiota bacterium]|nr:TolC family protein [Elusimicrobiota bacterium]
MFPAVVLLSLTPAHADTHDNEIWGLNRCIKTALEHNPTLSLAQEEISVSMARRRQATAALWATCTLRADETKGQAESGTGLPMFVQRSYGIQATQPLFQGGRRMATHRRSVLEMESACLEVEKLKNDIRHSVAESYWRIVALKNAIAAYRDIHPSLQSDLENAARHELSDNRNARIEFLTTRTQNRECEASLSELEEQLSENSLRLAETLGLPRSFQVRLVPDIPDGKAEWNEADCLKAGIRHRPEQRLARLLYEGAEQEYRIRRSELYPHIDLRGFYGRSGSSYVESDPFYYKEDWNAGVFMTWRLAGQSLKYDGNKERTSPHPGDSSRTETETQSIALTLGDAFDSMVSLRDGRKNYHAETGRYERSKQSVEEDIRSAMKRLRTAQARRDAARDRLEESLQLFKDTQSLLQGNRAHLGDLSTARNRVAAAQSARAQTMADYLIAVSALNQAIGIPDFVTVH